MRANWLCLTLRIIFPTQRTQQKEGGNMKKLLMTLTLVFGATFLFFAICETAIAEPPEKPGNPGVPGLLAEISELNQMVTDQNLTISELQAQIEDLQALLDAMQNYAPVPRTGQTVCYDSVGSLVDCMQTGQDGELQKGVPSPTPPIHRQHRRHGDGQSHRISMVENCQSF